MFGSNMSCKDEVLKSCLLVLINGLVLMNEKLVAGDPYFEDGVCTVLCANFGVLFGSIN